MSYYLHLPFGISISMQMLAYLSVPLFAALLYKFRRGKTRKLVIPVLFMMVTIFLLMCRVRSTSLFMNLVLLSAVLVTFAVWKGWYSVKKKGFLGILWGCLIGIPCAALLFGIQAQLFSIQSPVSAPYQTARMQEFCFGSGMIWSNRQLTALSLLSDCQWIGSSAGEKVMFDTTVSQISDYMVLHVISYYGILAFLAVTALFVILCWKMFGMSLRQKNQLGMVMGLGCSMVFLVQIAEYLMMNLGMIPPTLAFLPLISYGGSGTMISYILLGILLSVYRYQNLAKDSSLKRRRYRLRLERVQE